VTRFWEAALGEAACHRHLVIRPQERAKVVKNRVHVDLYVRDVASLLALGARVLAEFLPDRRVTLADVRVTDERLREESTTGDERVVPNRWQWSVTAGFDELMNAGASAAGDVPVDPDGNEVSAPGPVSSAG
jgi:hypothetical protein